MRLVVDDTTSAPEREGRTLPAPSAAPPTQADELIDTAIRPMWMRRASCVGRTELFFAPVGERPERRVRRERLAVALCGVCPVQVPCRDLARSRGERGLWGGETEADRTAQGYAVR